MVLSVLTYMLIIANALRQMDYMKWNRIESQALLLSFATMTLTAAVARHQSQEVSLVTQAGK